MGDAKVPNVQTQPRYGRHGTGAKGAASWAMASVTIARCSQRSWVVSVMNSAAAR